MPAGIGYDPDYQRQLLQDAINRRAFGEAPSFAQIGASPFSDPAGGVPPIGSPGTASGFPIDPISGLPFDYTRMLDNPGIGVSSATNPGGPGAAVGAGGGQTFGDMFSSPEAAREYGLGMSAQQVADRRAAQGLIAGRDYGLMGGGRAGLEIQRMADAVERRLKELVGAGSNPLAIISSPPVNRGRFGT